MSNLHIQLNQGIKYIYSQNKTKIEMPYYTNYSFMNDYPYETKNVPIKYIRLDHLTKEITGTFSGWKVLCIFNDILSPLEFFNKEYLIVPENYQEAIS